MTSFRGTSGSADTQPEKDNRDARHESKSAQHTENLTRGNLPKRQHSRSVIEQREKSTKPVFESREAIRIGDSVFHSAFLSHFAGRSCQNHRSHLGLRSFLPNHHSAHSHRPEDQERVSVKSRLLLLFLLHKCAVFTIVPAKGMLVVSPHPRLPIIALVSLCFFSIDTRVFPTPVPSVLHPSIARIDRISTATP